VVQKKEKLLTQKENISKLFKLTSFFTLEETNRQTNSSISSCQNTSKSKNSETVSTFDIKDKFINSNLTFPNIKTVVLTSKHGSFSSGNCESLTTDLPNPGTYYDEILKYIF